MVSNRAYELVEPSGGGRGGGGGGEGRVRSGRCQEPPEQLYDAIIDDAYNQIEDIAVNAQQCRERVGVPPHQAAGQEVVYEQTPV